MENVVFPPMGETRNGNFAGFFGPKIVVFLGGNLTGNHRNADKGFISFF